MSQAIDYTLAQAADLATDAGQPLSVTEPTDDWHEALPLQRMHQVSAQVVKLQGKQIAVFMHQGQLHACNNRCPHEGFPLVEGSLDAGCVLTCQWHNWKFDLTSGANLYGGDALRIYPVQVRNNAVWLNLVDPPAPVRIEQAMLQLEQAMDDLDRPRVARELARVEKAGGTVEAAIARAIIRGHDRLRYGMAHALAGADAWLRLRGELQDPVDRLTCASEALGYMAFEVLREPIWAFDAGRQPWQPERFLAVIEAQDEAAAVQLLQGAAHAGLGIEDLLPTLTDAALAHYSAFGHSVIFLLHLRRLIARLGDAVMLPLLRAWVRSVVVATREDLLPDFRAYADALARWPTAAQSVSVNWPVARAFTALPIKRTLEHVLLVADRPHAPVLDLLTEAAALHLLRFDESVALRVGNLAQDNTNWLDFSHALTFAEALRGLLPPGSSLWPQALLQMALFIGRNTPWLDTQVSAEQALAQWAVADEPAFDLRCRAQVLDHGQGLDIFAVHWLKTWTAVRDSVAGGLSPSARQASLAALNRLFAARFKPHHARRNAHQALAFVARES